MAKNNKKLDGRPTKFNPKYTEDLVKFFDIEPYKQVVSEQSTESFKDGGTRKESVKYRLIPNKMPTLYRFARKIDVSYKTVWLWAEKGEDEDLEALEKGMLEKGNTVEYVEEVLKQRKQLNHFCNAYKEAKELQKEFLINLGLAGAAPAPFAIFTAKNVTDMRDKVETDITSKGEKINTTSPEAIALAREYEERLKKNL